MTTEENQNCDPETGVCESTDQKETTTNNESNPTQNTIIYVGDPMCSWCYGIAPELQKLKTYYSDKYAFNIVVGGLRPGGGDPWNDQMKDMLAHHWKAVEERSGQPFGYSLLDKSGFNYDTEPSCRAVVAARKLAPSKELLFFESIQQKFYQYGEDPNQVNFYQSICEKFDINFKEFERLFEDENTKQLTQQEFQANRQWGVKGYPTVLFYANDQLYLIANGYTQFPELRDRIEQLSKEIIPQ